MAPRYSVTGVECRARATILALTVFSFTPKLVRCRIGYMGTTGVTKSTIEAFLKSNDKVLVDFFDPNDPKWPQEQSELEAALRQLRDSGSSVPFATVNSKEEGELTKQYVPHGNFPQLLWFLHGEITQYHRSLRTTKSITDFVTALDRDPIVVVQRPDEVTQYNRAVLVQMPKNFPMYKTVEVVAAKHMDTVAFVYIASAAKDEVVFHEEKEEPTKYDGAATVTALDQWIRRKLIKSEPVPDGDNLVWDEGSLVVVGATFEELVLRSDKDVFLYVYAPWCGFSKKFFKTWNAFARIMEKVSHVAIAKIDGDLNSSPCPEDFVWNAYPTLFYFRKGDQVPSRFHGTRNVTNLIEFVREQGSQPLDLDTAKLADDDVNEL